MNIADKDFLSSVSKSKLSRRMIKSVWSVFRFIVLLGVCYILMFPVMYMLMTSIRPAASVYDPSIIWIPKSLTLENFIMAISAMKYERSLVLTLAICIVSTIFQVLSCSLVGYGFARFKFKGNTFLFGVVILTLIIPPQNLVIPMYLNYYKLHLIDTVLSFYLPAMTATGIRAGLCILVFRQFFKTMSREIDEAAKIDGCGAIRIFFKVTLPNAKPAFITTALFSIVWYWNDSVLSSMFFNSDNPPIFGTGKTLSVALTMIRAGRHVRSRIHRFHRLKSISSSRSIAYHFSVTDFIPVYT